MERDYEDYTYKEERLYNRLWRIEREGTPRCWISRTVVSKMHPSEKQAVVKHPMNKVKGRILKDEHRHKADS